MKAKFTTFSVLFLLSLLPLCQRSFAQGTEIYNNSPNRWILHNPNDSRKLLVLAPINSSGSGYNWGAGFNFWNDGSLTIGAGKQSGYKLAVNGLIRAKEVRVNTGWSDFVFEEDYALPTLSEVESHIKTYGHLPSIPSAAEVESEGVELGGISSKLLQKIEELTLYVIAQEKRIAALEAENKALQE